MKITKEELLDMVNGAASKAAQAVLDEQKPPLIKDGADAADIGDRHEPDLTPFQKKFPNIKRHDPHGIPLDEFSFIRFINGSKKGRLTGFEKEAVDASIYQKTAIGSDEASTYGGYFVGEEFLPAQFVEYYRAMSVCRAAGINAIQCGATPVTIPTVGTGVTTYWVAENADITQAELVPGQISLNPHLLAARSQISKTLLRTSSGLAESIVRRDMAAAIAAAEDLGILEGSGSSGQPTGLANVTGNVDVEIGTDGGAITFAKLREMEYNLQLNNCKFIRPAWFLHPRTWSAIVQLLINSEANHFVMNPQQTDPDKKYLFGYPVFLSTQISIDLTKGSGTALANIFLADMFDVLLAEWGGVELDTSEEGDTAWKQYAVQVRAVKTLDVGARHAASIALINDSTS